MTDETMNKLMDDAFEHLDKARQLRHIGNNAAAKEQLCALMTGYGDYFKETTDAAPEEQQDDKQDHERHEEKGCVEDEPHSEHCV